MEQPKKYRYSGPVMGLNQCVQEHWEGVTIAVSEKRAKSNLAYRWKKLNGYAPTFKISLPQPLTVIR